MRICYLANSTIPSSTANSVATMKLCEAFTELKNEVILITTNVKKKNENLYKFYDIKFKFKIKRIKYFTEFPLGLRYYLFSLFSIIESFNYKPNLYITRNFFSCFLLVIFRKKVIIELHTDISNESRIVKFLVKFTKFLNSKYIVKIITITNGVRYEYVKNKYINERKTLVLPSGSAMKNNFKFNFKKFFFNIGYFGSLNNSRGVKIIFQLAKIDKKNKYFLYGDLNQSSKSIVNSMPKNLKLKNHIPYKDISGILDKMDILLLPYASSIKVTGGNDITKYTSPLKLFDYLCAGKIIMCSNFDVLKEVIKDKKNAIFVKNYKNPNSWKIEIIKLQNQLSKQFIISKNNYLLSKKFSLKRRAKLILNSII